MSHAETQYATVEKECLATVWAVQKFQAYLYGKPFILDTDHQPLQYLQRAKLSNGRLMRWTLLLHAFQFQVRVIPEHENGGADYPSAV